MPWPCQTLQRFPKADSAPPPWQPASDHAECHSSMFTVLIPVSSLAVNPSSQDLFPPPQWNCSCSGHPRRPPLIVAKINDQFSIFTYFHHLEHFRQAISPSPLRELSFDLLLTSLWFLSQFLFFSATSYFWGISWLNPGTSWRFSTNLSYQYCLHADDAQS